MKKFLLGLLVGVLLVTGTLNVLVFQAERASRVCIKTGMEEFKKAIEEGGNPFDVLIKQQECLDKAQKFAHKAFDILLAPARALSRNGEEK